MPKLPRVTARELIGAFERAGYVVRRQSGSHVVLRHPVTGQILVVPDHQGILGTGLVHSLLRHAKLSVADLVRLLGR